MPACPPGQFGNTPLEYDPLPTTGEYLEELKLNLRTPGYIKMSRVALAHFSKYCTREGITHPTDLTRSHIIKFQNIVNTNSEWSDSYKRGIMKILHSYINWLTDVGYLENNPWVRIKVGHTAKTPNPISDDQVEMLFEAHRRGAFSTSPFYFHRREMLLAVLLAWGVRLGEAAAMNASSFNAVNQYVPSINKGGGTKQLPYPAEMKIIYARYSGQRAKHSNYNEDALFITSKGERLSKDAIYKIIVDLGKEAGLDINPHMFRDTAGTNMLTDDMPVERVAKVLGHTNIKQTLQYSEVRDEAIARDHAASMNPRLKLLFKRTGDG